jgi:hypothetical protein
MKIISSIVIFFFLAVIIVAFYPIENAGNIDKDSPAYEIAKHKFYDEYMVYKTNLDKGIKTTPPVDPSGNFTIDENGNMNMVTNGSNHINPIVPGAQPDAVTSYIFAQSSSTYTSINGTGTLINGPCDDLGFGPFPIGFNFTYNGVVQTQFGAGCNGYIQFGAVAPALGYTPLLYYGNVVSPFAYDLYGTGAGGIYYQTTGTAPNRVCTIEWYQWGFYSSGGNELSFQIKLYEAGTNAVQIVYQLGNHINSRSLEVGITGATAADFLDRTTATNWAATTAGGSGATCSFSPTIFPASGLTFTWALPLPPPPPTPSLFHPFNHSIGNPTPTDTFTWTPSAGATSYRLQIALDTLMTTLIWDDSSSVNPSFILTGFPQLFTCWWRVRAINIGGGSAFTIPFTFKTKGVATQPALLTPANNAVNQPVALSCVWTHSFDQTIKPHNPINLHLATNVEPGMNKFSTGERDNIDAVTFYWYELYTDTTIAAVVKDSIVTDTTRAVSGLLHSQNYWWRVKARNEVGWGTFTPYFKFTTVLAPPAAPPSLIAPTNGLTGVIPTPLMDWSSVATATSYRIQISNDVNFVTSQVDTVVAVDSLLVPAGKLANNVQYYWHVYASNLGGNTAYSAVFHFTTSPLGVSGTGNVIPKVFKLYQSYPNPFNPSSTIKFDIPNGSDVKMVLYNTLGQEVTTLVNGHIDAGSYSVTWDASNFPSGVYFYKITAGNFTDIHKMVLIK